MLMWAVDEDWEQLVLWGCTPPPHAARGREPDSSHCLLALTFPQTPEVRGWEAISFRPSSLYSLAALNCFCYSKAKVSFANNSLSQYRRRLELKIVEKHEELELAWLRQCKEGSSLNERVASSTSTWSGPQLDGRGTGCCVGWTCGILTPGPVGHVFAALAASYSWSRVTKICVA